MAIERRFRRRATIRSYWGGLLLLLLVAYRAYVTQSGPPPVTEPGTYHVRRVVDGDTLLLDNGQRVRLLGVDTPETKRPDHPVEPLGPEASEFTRDHVEGRTVRLQFDRERRDRFNRLLAYVYVGDWFLNEELIRSGFSRAQMQYPYSSEMKRRFRAAENEARIQHRGVWGLSPRSQ
jgi:micrococcal nuclease